MKIIIDTCVLPLVFNDRTTNHEEYKPILICLGKRKIKICLGGKKYKDELAKCYSYLKKINELAKARLVISLSDNDVDTLVEEIRKIETDPNFDDPHLIAIQIISKSELICTEDVRAIPFIKKKELYPKRHKLPKIYTGSRNADLLPK